MDDTPSPRAPARRRATPALSLGSEDLFNKVLPPLLAALAAALAMLAVRPAVAQFGQEVPRPSYYIGVDELYAGDYRGAERTLRRETQRGIRTVNARWIDAICYHAMLGEVLYHQGRNAEALAEFDQASRLLLTYPDWLQRVNFQQTPRPDPNRARRAPPWGRSSRQFAFGSFPATELILLGRIDNTQVIQQGGVVLQPQFWRLNIIEVARASALTIRRRNELLGPLGRHDRISKELADILSRGNLAPANHWSRAWTDLLRGLAVAGIGKFDEADALFTRAAVIDGQLDHPLTCIALMEQGRLAMIRGNSQAAAYLLGEAGFSAYSFDNWDVLTESTLLGWINHLASGGAGVSAPIPAVAAWAQGSRLQHIGVKLRLAEAESYVWLGQAPQAAAALDDATRRLGTMRAGLPGIHQLYVQALVHLQARRPGPAGEVLGQALAAQANASLRNFQIVRTSEMYDSREIPPRLAVEIYEALLSDPTPADWAYHPLDMMAVLKSSHDAAFDRWFIAALERKDPPLALEVAERAKRSRFLSSLPLGGRLMALRVLLEAPPAELSGLAVLQRQQLLAFVPAYQQLANTGAALEQQLRAGSLVAQQSADSKPLADRYKAWQANAEAREQLVLELALRRVPSAFEFPPLRETADIQASLAEGEALVVFHAAAGDVYGFLLARNGANLWQVGDVRNLQTGIGRFLRELGNFGPTRTLDAAELQNSKWRDSGGEIYQAIFADSRLSLEQTTSLTIVPDGPLWYLPFEALVPTEGAEAETPLLLADRVRIRLGPTAALALASPRPMRRPQHTGIVAVNAAKNDSAVGGEAALAELENVVPGPVRFAPPLPEPGNLFAPLLDTLVVLDDVELDSGSAYAWSPLPRSRGRGADSLGAWFSLPYGGPQSVILAGFATAAETGLGGVRRRDPAGPLVGTEIFQTVCGLMANSARTIVLSRWRTGGRTNFDLVREFVQESPTSTATEAWQRSVTLARETPLEAGREPRLKRPDAAEELPTADHPFFWAGYMLVDSGLRDPPPELGGRGQLARQNAAEPAPDGAPPGEEGALESAMDSADGSDDENDQAGGTEAVRRAADDPARQETAAQRRAAMLPPLPPPRMADGDAPADDE